MPWKQIHPMEERMRFLVAYQERLYTMSELCERFGISRKTGYKWIQRFQAEGPAALADRSRRPHSCPHQMEASVRTLLIEARRAHPTWGPRKIRRYLQRRHRGLALPAPSTIGALFVKEGLVQKRKRRRVGRAPASRPLFAPHANAVWQIDFKGEFRLGCGRYCYPLTVSDAFSRYLIGCDALTSTATTLTWRSMEALFQQYGLPQAIRTDNGTPFAGTGLSRLSRLSVYWTKLGIRHERIDLGKPQQNGRHERLHRTLKQETARPPQFSFPAQQQRFDGFRHQYNYDRPHEALEMDVPASRYRPSLRRYPSSIEAPPYPGHYEIRRVRSDGSIKFHGALWFVSETLIGEEVALEEIEDGIWSLLFYDVLIGRLDEHRRKVVP